MLEYSCWIATEANAFLHLIILCEKCGKRRQRNIIISYWLLCSAVSVLGTSKFELDEGPSNFLWSHRGQKQWWCYDTDTWILCSQVLSCQHPLSPARNWQKTWTQHKCTCFTDAVLVTHLNWDYFLAVVEVRWPKQDFLLPGGPCVNSNATMAQGMFCNEHGSNTKQEKKKSISCLKPIICPVRIPPVRKMEVPMAKPPLRCFGANSPI